MPVAFDTTGMERHDERTWFDPRTGDQVSLTYIGLVPDIPAPLDDLTLLRRKLAEETAETGSIIEAHVVSLDGVPTLFQLIKLPIPGQDTGLAFIAAFTVPRDRCSAVLRIQCAELNMTGQRESTVAAQVGFEHCFPPHPYAPHVHGQLPYNVADESTWDQHFPDHPLTRARAWAQRTLATARVDPRFKALPPFQSEPPSAPATPTPHPRPDAEEFQQPTHIPQNVEYFSAPPDPVRPTPVPHQQPLPTDLDPTPPTPQPAPAADFDLATPAQHRPPAHSTPADPDPTAVDQAPPARATPLAGLTPAPTTHPTDLDPATPQPAAHLDTPPADLDLFAPEPHPSTADAAPPADFAPTPPTHHQPPADFDPTASAPPAHAAPPADFDPAPPAPHQPAAHPTPPPAGFDLSAPEPATHRTPPTSDDPATAEPHHPSPAQATSPTNLDPAHQPPAPFDLSTPEPATHRTPPTSDDPATAEPHHPSPAQATSPTGLTPSTPHQPPTHTTPPANLDPAAPTPPLPGAHPSPHTTGFDHSTSASPADVGATPSAAEPEASPEPVPSAEAGSGRRARRAAEGGDVLHTVLVGLPLAGYLPLWQEGGVTFWRMKDPEAVRARLGAGVETRSEVGTRRYREAAMFSPSRGTLFLMDRVRDESGHLGGTSTQLEAATEEEAYAAVDGEAISELYAWLGEVALASLQRGEFMAVETGGWDVPSRPVVLIMLRTDGREWHSVVETSPVPVGAPVWRDQQPVDGDTQVLASPATDQTVRASGLLTRFAVGTWGMHPFELGLSFGPNPTL